MDTLEILIAARKLIENPENWTQHWFARDAEGKSTQVHSDDAVCFCAMGALHRVAGLSVNETTPCSHLFREICGTGIGIFNDNHTHAEVLAAFDRAIESAREHVGAQS